MSDPRSGRPAFVVERPRRGLGIALIVAGIVLAVPGLLLSLLCSPAILGACLPGPGEEVPGFVAGLGLTLLVLGPLLVFTRWQYARVAGFCPSCGTDCRGAERFCPRCGRLLG